MDEKRKLDIYDEVGNDIGAVVAFLKIMNEVVNSEYDMETLNGESGYLFHDAIDRLEHARELVKEALRPEELPPAPATT